MSGTIALVGCGNMGFAMLKGWLANGVATADAVHVVEPAQTLRERAASLGVHVHDSAGGLMAAQAPQIAIMAVKPQVMEAVLADYVPLAAKGTTFVSVAAGVPIATFARALGGETPISRVMPNTPSAVGQGMMVVCNNDHVSEAAAARIDALMAASGAVAHVTDEALMDAVTAVSGSGPAYLFHMIEALRDAALGVGLPDDIALLLARQTIFGAATYAVESGEDPALLRQQVTSPGGTTAAALGVLMDKHGLSDLMTRAVTAARDRGRELGKSGA